MEWQAWATLAIIIATMAVFATEKVRIDLVALSILVLLLALGIIDINEALSGFSNEATITIAAMFALTLGIERSGVLNPVSDLLIKIRNPWLMTLALMLTIASMGAFIKNIPLVATFLPLALRVCKRSGTPPSRVLMPMAYAAQMGGVCTLLGTSSNLLANTMAQQYGLAPIGVFEFTAFGAILAAVGITYLMLIRWWLPSRPSRLQYPVEQEIGKYVAELRITAHSTILKQTIANINMGSVYGVYPLELLRGNEQQWSPRSQQLIEDDVLLVRGDWEKIEDFCKQAKLEYNTVQYYGKVGDAPKVLVEAMVVPVSHIEHRTIPEIGLYWSYKANVLAIHRRGQILRKAIKSVELALGDVLLMLVDEDMVSSLRNDSRFIVLSEREKTRSTHRQAWLASIIMVAVIIVSGFKWLPIPVAAICGVIAMAFTGCYGRKSVYESIDWKIIILLGAILPLGIAIEKTGLSHIAVSLSMGFLDGYWPLAALLVVYLLTALLTEFIGHNPSVLLMIGIAVSLAHSVHVDPRPFVVAVAFAAATSFATPIGYPTNTMIYYAGGYRFTDFMKIGIPLNFLFCALSMWLIPIFWPLTLIK